MSVLANSNVISGDTAIDTGDIGHSLRFRASASAYLSRTFGTPTNNTVWSYSLWIKRGALSVSQSLFGASTTELYINDANQLAIYKAASVATSSSVLRDPLASMHLCFVSNGTTVKGYRNNEEILSYTGTLPLLNSAITHTIGKYAAGSADYLDGCASRVCFVDGQALTPSSFGYLNTEINEWVSKTQSQVKSVVDAGGTNSFMLDFDNGTSLTTLGYDKSSKSNNWSLNNFSLTAGATYDWMLDVPGNSYATKNALCKPSGFSPSDGNLSCVYNATGTIPATIGVTSGEWYWEETYDVAPNGEIEFGVAATGFSTSSQLGTADAYGWAYSPFTGSIYHNGTVTNIGGQAIGTVFGFKLDVTAQTLKIYAGTTLIYTFNSVSGTTLFPAAGCSASNSAKSTSNYGQIPFANPSNVGTAKALCQANIPDGETITVSGSFTGNLNADGPYVDIKGTPTAMTINGNAVTFGTHADKTAFGFKLRTASSSYNNTGSNTFSVSSTGPKRKYALAKGNP